MKNAKEFKLKLEAQELERDLKEKKIMVTEGIVKNRFGGFCAGSLNKTSDYISVLYLGKKLKSCFGLKMNVILELFCLNSVFFLICI